MKFGWVTEELQKNIHQWAFCPNLPGQSELSESYCLYRPIHNTVEFVATLAAYFTFYANLEKL